MQLKHQINLTVVENDEKVLYVVSAHSNENYAIQLVILKTLTKMLLRNFTGESKIFGWETKISLEFPFGHNL